MPIPTLSSTVLLTLLLAIGLIFFIRASTKDRIQVVQFVAEPHPESMESFLEQLQQYFTERSYRIAAVDPEQNQVTFRGFVRPSVFLAIFLTALAAVGILCLVLVLSILFPQKAQILSGLVVLAPLAGIFYWKKSGREEQVSLKVDSRPEPYNSFEPILTVTGHRDEVAELQSALNLKPLEAES